MDKDHIDDDEEHEYELEHERGCHHEFNKGSPSVATETSANPTDVSEGDCYERASHDQ